MNGVKWSRVLFISCGFLVSIAQASSEMPELVGNELPARTSIEDPRSQLHGWITAILSVLVICSGFGYSVLISTYREQTFRRQDILGLMSLMASLCWWVVTVTVASPSDGKSGSVSTWIALFAVFIARHRHGLRNRNSYLFTSLLGGIIGTAFVAAVIMLASEDTSRTKPPSMGNFVGLAVTVGPTVATVWCWMAAFAFETVEGQRMDTLESETQEVVELAVRTAATVPVQLQAQ